ncbi:hypothetical protein DAEQUDRAFT_231740 [Daedalea quercina L-15889]|uniref:Wax synthase domain-containing protein n=1 Tax=Daedalea quercina L-15889 TaxID=1314783 RepID=A0A165QU09_9APHY|nr:hypothetical protein DAEQUDRAFT_231740 [Daedalea quercina L-15889]
MPAAIMFPDQASIANASSHHIRANGHSSSRAYSVPEEYVSMAQSTPHDHARFPVLPLLLTYNLALASLLISSPPFLWRLGGTIVCLALCLAPYLDAGVGDNQRNYSTGCTLMIQAFTGIYLLWMSDPVHDFRHEREYTAPDELPFLRRLYWGLSIMNNPRGVGWTCQVANVPPAPSEPRWGFVRRRLKRAFYWYMLLDLIQCYERQNPVFSGGRADWKSVSSQGYLLRPVNIFMRVAGVAAGLAMQHALFAVVTVAIGFSLPRDWPDIYGRWSDAYTVRRFWGRSYHQMLRRLTASAGKAVCRILALRPGSSASSYTQLYVGFAVSGLIHCGGDLMVDPIFFGSSFLFFMSQAVAITVEDAVIGAARMMQLRIPQRLAHIVGYAWVLFWMNLSCPWYIDWSLKAGIIDADRVPFSLITLALRNPDAAVAVFFYAIFFSTTSYK